MSVIDCIVAFVVTNDLQLCGMVVFGLAGLFRADSPRKIAEIYTHMLTNLSVLREIVRALETGTAAGVLLQDSFHTPV